MGLHWKSVAYSQIRMLRKDFHLSDMLEFYLMFHEGDTYSAWTFLRASIKISAVGGLVFRSLKKDACSRAI